ncbi:HD domain-containing protein [Candidatus Saccharibacteria bacterium]|nr:HD domain-containing protein [Candidatus Saccharibacteria bacterium]
MREVEILAVCMGIVGGLPDEDIKILAVGAGSHDIGKVREGIQQLISAPRHLSAAEMDQVKTHVEFGVYLARASMLDDVSPRAISIIGEHHERRDGSGYPKGLKGDEIDVLAEITGIADTYDAITSDRPHEKARSQDEAIDIARGEARKGRFRERWVEALVTVVTNPGYRRRAWLE